MGFSDVHARPYESSSAAAEIREGAVSFYEVETHTIDEGHLRSSGCRYGFEWGFCTWS